MRRYFLFLIFAVFCAIYARATDHFVSLTSPNPTAPYLNWDTAAHVIQDAIDAADPGDTVIVTNGLYNTGGRVVYETLTNRIAITKPLTVRSVNGPDVTIIEGHQLPDTTNGPAAVRGVYMTNNTTLIGFTITHGATYTNTDSFYDECMGGVWCANFTNSVLSNCVIIANAAYDQVGGVLLGTLNNCVIAGNSDSSEAGGCFYSTLNHCLVTSNSSVSGVGGVYGNSGGGAIPFGTQPPVSVNYCIIAGNSSPNSAIGAGAFAETLNHCLLIGNQGSAAKSCYLFNCTVVSNSIGLDYSIGRNCISYYNSNGNVVPSNTYESYVCTTPLPPYGFGNITNEPLFLDPAHGDFHLQPNSPCINSGCNNYLTITNNWWDTPDKFYFTFVTNDLDGNPRVVAGTVDMGAYEFQSPVSKISYAWLLQNGFPTDGSADDADPDHDRMNNFQEWRAGTAPMDSASVLQMFPPVLSISGATVTWQSQPNITYCLQRASPLGAFSTIQSNIVGQAGTTSYTDPASTTNSSFFYRVGVQ
jgi:hypothetical protein